MLSKLNRSQIRRMSIFLPLALLFSLQYSSNICFAAKAAEPVTQPNLTLTVDDINDLGYALQRIRQQAINIYIEATRKRGAAEVSAQLSNLNAVPDEIPAQSNDLRPFRRPWLVYFITTLEPLVHLLKEDVKSVENGSQKIDVSPSIRAAIDPMIKQWSQGVLKIDEKLGSCTQLVEDAGKNNISLAKLALEIDKEVSTLEQVRQKAFDVVEEMQKKEKAEQESKSKAKVDAK